MPSTDPELDSQALTEVPLSFHADPHMPLSTADVYLDLIPIL